MANAKAMFKVKQGEWVEAIKPLGITTPETYVATAIIFSACIIAEAISNLMNTEV